MKIGMVLEGGAMRGMYTAGVLDVMMENDVQIGTVMGVSAGAVFGCNYKSRQIGRTIRYNKKYCSDPRYVSVKNLVREGDIYGEFCYSELPTKLDPFDVDTYRKTPVDFYLACTDVHTGETIYHLCNDGGPEDIQWMRASASMPLVSRPVRVGGYDLLDGGITDSIPLAWMQAHGFEKNVVVLTRPEGYRKKKSSGAGIMKVLLHKYPAVARAMKERPEKYNAQVEAVEQAAREGSVFLIRPSRLVEIERIEKNPEKLEEMYQLGRSDAAACLADLRAFIAQA